MFKQNLKRRKGRLCAAAAVYLDSVGITKYMQLSFNSTSEYQADIYHSDYGQVLRAEKDIGMITWVWKLEIFRYGNWVDQLLEYEKTVRSAEKKKHFEDLQEAFKDLEEDI